MNSNELEAIKLCQKGHTEHFTTLYDLYAEKIYKFLYYRTLHAETAEDLTSEAFFKALKKIKSFNENKAQFSTWLYQIARNTLIDHYRKSHPTEDLETAYDAKDVQNLQTDTDTKLKFEAVQKKLKHLTPLQQQIIILRLWDDLSHKEIANILSISEANSKMTFSRSIAKLQTELGASLVSLIVTLINLKQ